MLGRLPMLEDRWTPRPSRGGWLAALRSGPRARAAIARLHELLLRAARFELSRRRRRAGARARRGARRHRDAGRRRRADGRARASSTTSAARAASRPGPTSSRCSRPGVRLRRRAWQGREVVLDAEAWPARSPTARDSAHEGLESAELLAALRDGDRRRAHAAPARGVRRAGAERACRSTCWPSGSAPRAARSTRPCTTRAASCARGSPSTGLAWPATSEGGWR